MFELMLVYRCLVVLLCAWNPCLSVAVTSKYGVNIGSRINMSWLIEVKSIIFMVSEDYCSGDYFEARCAHDEVIVMETARYGRMRMGKCISYDLEIGCGADVTHRLDTLCSGKQSCRHRILDADFKDLHDCPNDLVGFLEASYSCQSGRFMMGVHLSLYTNTCRAHASHQSQL